MNVDPATGGASGAPAEEAVRACLGNMLSAPQFSDSPQLASFLKFIVEETLSGRGGELKGYSIATLALNRPESFDPQTDPIVRVQAGRLRQAMAEYAEAFPDEPVMIMLEKGAYAPRFVTRQRAERVGVNPVTEGQAKLRRRSLASAPEIRIAALFRAPGQQGRFMRMAVLGLAAIGISSLIAAGLYLGRQRSASRIDDGRTQPFERFAPSLIVEADGSASSDLQGLVQRTRDAVARFDDIVIVHDLADMVSSAPRSALSQAGSVMTLRISAVAAAHQTVRFNARLVDQADQAMLWSREFDPVAAGPEGDAARTGIVRAVATAVAQPYGVIQAHVRSRLASGPARNNPYGCIVSGFDYWRSNDVQAHALARDCLTQRIKDFPTIASLRAQLSYLHLEEYRQGYNPLPGKPLDRALESARRAAALAPASARSQQALLAVHFARGEMESAWRAAGEAMALNPFDTEILADVGARHVQSGHYEKGLGMLQQALELNPAPPIWAVTFRAAAYYLLGRIDQSGPIASALSGNDYPLAMMALVMVARQSFDESGGKAALVRMQALHPGIVADPAAYLRRLSFDPGTMDRLVRDFGAARDWAVSRP